MFFIVLLNLVIYKRIPDDEKPLILCLSWGSNKDMSKSFALKENEEGKVQVSRSCFLSHFPFIKFQTFRKLAN